MYRQRLWVELMLNHAVLTDGESALPRRRVEALHEALSGDSAPGTLIDFYCAFRAGMRVRFAVAHLPSLSSRARDSCTQKALSFLQIAERHASAMG